MNRLLQSLLLGAAILFAGCPICDPVSEVVDDFDRACADGPCGWTAETGSVTNTPTFHDSEQGMALAPGTRARRDFTGSSISWTPSALELTARCDPETILRVSIVGTDSGALVDGSTGTAEVRRSLDVDVAATELFQVYENSFSWPFGVPVDEVVVEVAGPGGCIVDDIVLTSQPLC